MDSVLRSQEERSSVHLLMTEIYSKENKCSDCISKILSLLCCQTRGQTKREGKIRTVSFFSLMLFFLNAISEKKKSSYVRTFSFFSFFTSLTPDKNVMCCIYIN